MLFAIRCVDKPDSTDVRAAARPEHLEFVAAILDQVRMAGPLLTDDGETMRGSLLIIDFADRAAAEQFCADDPYAKAGLFESVTVDAFTQSIP